MNTLRNPLLDYMGIDLIRWEEGLSEFGLAIEPRHLNRQGRLQGGVIATMLDVCSGYAGIAPESEMGALTITLNINYVSGVAAGHVVARGRVIGGGRRIFFAEGQVFAEDGRLVATAQGSFKRLSGAE